VEKIKNKFHIIFFVFFIVTAASSCAENAFYDQTYDFKNETWKDLDTALFELDVQNTEINYNFFLTLRTTKNYKFSNLWVKIIIEAPDKSKSVMAQRIDIANPDGSWKGRVSGSIVENRLHYKTNAFPLTGKYTFKIVQAVNQESIDGVLDIGMRIEEID
jgi:gliding motility-associated lipoprotein GldH